MNASPGSVWGDSRAGLSSSAAADSSGLPTAHLPVANGLSAAPAGSLFGNTTAAVSAASAADWPATVAALLPDHANTASSASGFQGAAAASHVAGAACAHPHAMAAQSPLTERLSGLSRSSYDSNAAVSSAAASTSSCPADGGGQRVVALASTAPAPAECHAALFASVGGPEGVEAAVDEFYRRMFGDPRVSPFFEGVDSNKLVVKQVQFMVVALGGAPAYKGRDLRQAHARLVLEKGLNLQHFDIALEHFRATLEASALPQSVVDEAMANLEATRPFFDPSTYSASLIDDDYLQQQQDAVRATHRPASADGFTLANGATFRTPAEAALLLKLKDNEQVAAVVNRLYEQVIHDGRISHFFVDVDRTRLKFKLLAFLACAFGGPLRYNPKNLAYMHSHLAEAGLTMEHFDIVLGHFRTALSQEGASQDLLAEATYNVNCMRPAFQQMLDRAHGRARRA